MTPTQSETLLPCPFCKQAVHIIKGQTEGSCDWIEHLSPTEECGLEFSDFNLTGDLATAWNTRLQSIPEPLSDEGLVERHAELQHWFFQKLNPEQRTAFLFAAGVAPRTCDLTFGMQHQALRQVSAALSIPRLEAGRVTEADVLRVALAIERADDVRGKPEGTLNHPDVSAWGEFVAREAIAALSSTSPTPDSNALREAAMRALRTLRVFMPEGEPTSYMETIWELEAALLSSDPGRVE